MRFCTGVNIESRAVSSSSECRERDCCDCYTRICETFARAPPPFLPRDRGNADREAIVGLLQHTRILLSQNLPVASQKELCKYPVGNQHGKRHQTGHARADGPEDVGRIGAAARYGIARRIEQISGELLAVNQGTLYPVLLKLEQEGAIASQWGSSENNRRARFYRLTRAGRKQLQAETEDWEETAAVIGRFFAVKAEDLQ
jgi:PadR family transcriptional regulator, regulatory protein PadR